MKCELIYASDYEEFFYEEDGMPVSEGQPVGIELELGEEYKSILLEGIYHYISNEET